MAAPSTQEEMLEKDGGIPSQKRPNQIIFVCWVVKQAVAPATIYTFQYGFLYGRWILCK